jgi:hypothetical protein
MDLSQAIEKHVQWKTRLRAAISAKETLDADTIAKDDCCDIGRWMYGDGKAQYGQLPSFKQCVTKHALFHTEAAKVARVINAKRYDEADHMLRTGTPYAAASTDVGVALIRLKQDAKL